MKVEYVEGGQAGYGSLVFSGAILPEEPWKVAIQRGSDQKYLTGKKQNPWVGEIFFIDLNGKAAQDSSVTLDVGPGIVDNLDQQENYRITLRGNGGEELRSRLQISAINYSPGGSLDNTADVAQTDAPEQTPEKPEPSPIPEPAPEPEPAPAPAPEPAPERLEMERQPQGTSPKVHYLRWGLIGLLVLACIAWFWFDPRNKQEPASSQTSEEAPKLLPPQSSEDQVRGFFKSGKMTPKQAAELAAKLPKGTPGEKDAVYRLYYFAAENGEPSVLLAYAACLDPSQPAWGSIEKNALEAWNAYKKAPDQEKAAQAMTHLRGWLEDQARSGNRKAAQWLAEIEK